MKQGRLGAILLAAAVAACACGSVEPGGAPSPSNRAGPCALPDPPLRDLAEGRTIGTAYRSSFADGDRCYAEIAGREFGSLTTEIGTMTNTVAPAS